MAIDVRKNFASLSSAERTRYTNAVRRMLLGPSNTYSQFPIWHDLPAVLGVGHRNVAFLAWHRIFIRLFELRLKEADIALGGDGSITLPYWDWPQHDSTTSILWRNSFMGPDGSGTIPGVAPNVVVQSGPFAHPNFVSPGDPNHPGWLVPVTDAMGVTRNVVLTRRLGDGGPLPRRRDVRRAIAALPFDIFPYNNSADFAKPALTAPTTAVGTTLTLNRTEGLFPRQRVTINPGGGTSKVLTIQTVDSDTQVTLRAAVGAVFPAGTAVHGAIGSRGRYRSVRNMMEGFIGPGETNVVPSMHNAVHVWVGGTMGVVPTAPVDPVFFLHHCNVDRIWAKWQLAHPALTAQWPSAANITAAQAGPNPNAKQLTDPLVPWIAGHPQNPTGMVFTAQEVLNWQAITNPLLHNPAGDSYKYDDDPSGAFVFT